MPVLPPAPACPTVTTRGCGCTSAPPAGAGQHSWGHWHLQYPSDISCFSAISSTVLHLLIFSCSPLLIHNFPLPHGASSGFFSVAVTWVAAALVGLTCSCCPWGRHMPAGVRCSSPQERVVLCGVAAASGVQTAEERISVLLRGCLVWGARLVTEV